MKKDMDDYLQEGLYGAKDLNRSERKQYLGTLRERIVLALSEGEVMQGKGLKELKQLMTENPDAYLLLNSEVHFRFFKPYKKLAKTQNINYTSVTNEEADSEYGVILTHDHAIDKEDIFLKEIKKEVKENNSEKNRSFFSRLFGK